MKGRVIERIPNASLLAFTAMLVVVLLGTIDFAQAQATNWQDIPIPKLPAFHPAEPKRIQLPDGMVIFLQEDHELPLIDGTIPIRGGSRMSLQRKSASSISTEKS